MCDDPRAPEPEDPLIRLARKLGISGIPEEDMLSIDEPEQPLEPDEMPYYLNQVQERI